MTNPEPKPTTPATNWDIELAAAHARAFSIAASCPAALLQVMRELVQTLMTAGAPAAIAKTAQQQEIETLASEISALAKASSHVNLRRVLAVSDVGPLYADLLVRVQSRTPHPNQKPWSFKFIEGAEQAMALMQLEPPPPGDDDERAKRVFNRVLPDCALSDFDWLYLLSTLLAMHTPAKDGTQHWSYLPIPAGFECRSTPASHQCSADSVQSRPETAPPPAPPWHGVAGLPRPDGAATDQS